MLQFFQPAPVARRYPHTFAAGRVRNAVLRVAAHFGACDLVDLVEYQQLRQIAGTDGLQHFVDLQDAFFAQRVCRIDNVQQQIGIARLRQRRAERGDQLVRKITHEADRVGKNRAAARQRNASHGGIERGEQLICHVSLCTGQHVEQRRLAGIGVTDQCNPWQFAAHPRTTHLGALHLDLFQPLLQLFDALLQQAAVGFQLGFAGAAQADGATALTLQMRPATHQPRGHVAQLRQFHLQLAFVAARTLREDVQDQPGAVDHTPLQIPLQVALLARRQGVIDQHQIGAGGLGCGLDLFQLAATDQGRRAGLIDACGERGRHRGARRLGKVGELLQHIVFGRPAGVGLYQQRVFTLAGPIKHALLRYCSTSSSSA